MTDLTPEALAKADHLLRLGQGGEWRLSEIRDLFPALLAAARERDELKGALEFLTVSDRRVVLVVDYRAPGEATYQTRSWAVLDVAKSLGWTPASVNGGKGAT